MDIHGSSLDDLRISMNPLHHGMARHSSWEDINQTNLDILLYASLQISRSPSSHFLLKFCGFCFILGGTVNHQGSVWGNWGHQGWFWRYPLFKWLSKKSTNHNNIFLVLTCGDLLWKMLLLYSYLGYVIWRSIKTTYFSVEILLKLPVFCYLLYYTKHYVFLISVITKTKNRHTWYYYCSI